MEIKYTRTFTAKNKKYGMGELSGLNRYAMEILEPRPILEEGKLEPGEVCMLLFGISAAEFNMKDSDPDALDALAERLRREVPKDRMISAMARTLTGKLIARPLKLRMCDTIDGGKFISELKTSAMNAKGPLDEQLRSCAQLQRRSAEKDATEAVKEEWRNAKIELGEAIMHAEKLFVAFESNLKSAKVSVGYDGRIEVFTTQIRFEAARRQIAKVNADNDFWVMKEVAGSEIEGFLRNCEMNGLYLLRIDNGFAAAELDLRDFRTETAEGGEEIRALMTREIEYGLRFNALKQNGAPEKNINGALESMLTMRNFVRRLIGNAVLYALCDLGADTFGRHCTHGARMKLKGDDWRLTAAEKTILINRKEDSTRHLVAFTTAVGAAAFAERIADNACPVAMTFDDLANRCREANGILIDPNSMGYILKKEDFENVRELRGKNPVAVRVRPFRSETPTHETPVPETPAPVRTQAEAALPDPDGFDIPTVREEATEAGQPQTAAEPESVSEAPEKEKKSFLRRLFGKKSGEDKKA